VPPPDDFFSVFLGHTPKQFCVDCLTAIYGDSDANAVRARLDELGDAIEMREAMCSNCDAASTTYRARRAS
jgi:hypothetical protein